MDPTPHIAPAIAAIELSTREADRYCDEYYASQEDSDFANFNHYVERAFTELLVLLDRLNLTAIYQRVMAEFETAQKDGFAKTIHFEDMIFSKWTDRIRLFTDAVAASYGLARTAQSAVNDLKEVLERAAYVICDTKIFPRVPQNEADVHDRLEAILKCHYPDLKRKPRLNKPIKSFEPDTGIASAKTLLEYKFITTLDEAKKAVEQILADASGYRSREWTNLLFVIYETKRVIPVDDWRSLLNDCDLLEGFDVMVLPGADLDAA